MKFNVKFAVVMFVINSTALAATPSYKIIDSIAIGGAPKWDYLYVDSSAHRLYVAHGTQTEVIDIQSGKAVGIIPQTEGVHGIAIANDLGLGFTSDGKAYAVTVFDLTTLQVRKSIKVGTNPDSIVYSPKEQKIVVFNGRSSNASVIDAKKLEVIATIPVGGKPEFSALGANGAVNFNVENTGELATLDLHTNQVSLRHSLNPCEEPSGLAMDDKQHIFSVCANHLMMVSDANGNLLSSPSIGAGPDGVAWLDGYAFSANGADGNISMVGEVDGKFKTVATIPTAYGARTIAADPATHRLYLPTADFKPAEGTAKRQGLPETFRVLVLQQQ